MHRLLGGLLANARALGGWHGRVGTLIVTGVVLAMAQAPAAQKIPRIVVSASGDPVIAEIIAYSVEPKSLGLTGADGVFEFDPKLLTDKNVSIATGTPMVIYTLACQDDKIRLFMAPQSSSTQDIGCANASKPIVEGQNCDCKRVAGGPWGNDFKVSVPGLAGGMSMPKVLTFTGIGIGAIAGAAVALGEDADSGSSSGPQSGPSLTSLSGNYTGLVLTQTSSTCNPQRFANTINASASAVVDAVGNAVRLTVIESATFILNGALQLTGNTASGTVTGNGTTPAGTQLSITALVEFAVGSTPNLMFRNYSYNTLTGQPCVTNFGSNTVPLSSR